MFRLVKVMNGDNKFEATRIKYADNVNIEPGCALICTNGVLSAPASTSTPAYVSLSSNHDRRKRQIDAMIVTEDMVFKVEFTGSMTPQIGMIVGLSMINNKMDAVTYNTNGKGTIIGIEAENNMVYVIFNK